MPLAYLTASIKTNNYNKFDGIMQINLTRDKVEIDKLSAGAEYDWNQSTTITRISQSNCHNNSYSGMCFTLKALLLLINQTVDNCVCY